MSWSSSAIRMRKRYWLHSRSICRSAYTILFDDNEAITPITTTTSTFANAINGPTVYIHLPIIWLLVVQMLVLVLILKCYVSTIIFFIFCNNFKFKLQIIILTQIVWVDSDTGTVVTMFRANRRHHQHRYLLHWLLLLLPVLQYTTVIHCWYLRLGGLYYCVCSFLILVQTIHLMLLVVLSFQELLVRL